MLRETGAPRHEQQNPALSFAFCAIKPTSLALAKVWREERKFPESINIPRCSLAAAAHTKNPPVHLQGCQEGSALLSQAWKTPLATATSSCSAGRAGAPRAPRAPTAPSPGAQHTPLGDGKLQHPREFCFSWTLIRSKGAPQQ